MVIPAAVQRRGRADNSAPLVVDGVECGIGVERAAAAVFERGRLKREEDAQGVYGGEDVQAVPVDARLGHAATRLECAADSAVPAADGVGYIVMCAVQGRHGIARPGLCQAELADRMWRLGGGGPVGEAGEDHAVEAAAAAVGHAHHVVVHPPGVGG